MKKSKLSLKGKSTAKPRAENEVKENRTAAAAPATADNRPAQVLAELNTSSRSSGLNSELNGPDDYESRYNDYKVDCEWVPMPTFQSLFEEIKINSYEKVQKIEEDCSLPCVAPINLDEWVPLPKSCRKCMTEQFLKVKLIKCEEDINFNKTSVAPPDSTKTNNMENLTIEPSKSGRITGSEVATLKSKHFLPNLSGRSEKTHVSPALTKNKDHGRSKLLTTFKENPSKVLPSNKHLNKRKPLESSSSPVLQASKRIRMEKMGVSDGDNSSSGIIGSLKDQTPAKELLTQCPMCRSDFDYRMTQMEIDEHVARCLSAVDDDVVW